MTRFTFRRPYSLSPGPGRRRRRSWPAAAVVAAAALATMAAAASPAGAEQARFRQVNLVSDIPGVAPLTDPDLLNAWGLAATPGTDQAPGSPLWVSDNGSDKTTLFAGATPTSVTQVLVVNITAGAPTGQVFNPDRAGFLVHDAAGHSGSALFIFASENGAIDAWNPGVGATGTGPSTVTETPVSNGANAVYKGLAIAQASDGHTYLYATNFRSGRVEVYDSNFQPARLPGGLFTDPGIPAGYAPFGIQELAGELYVTYAKQDAALHDDVAGQGHGFVDVFSNDGALIRRLVSHGQLNSPWGLALAPAGFGGFGGALLVGNFGDGHINAYNPDTGTHLGQLRGPGGHPIVIDGLWGLRFGNGNAAKTEELVFSAGPNGEADGLLGKIVVAG
ncbi:MAG TPA: TIGR03118 family protein [Streptosporangiaceae bacterium]